jgi:hypothetical protein
VDAEADSRGRLPIACTLGPSAGVERVRDWQRVLQEAGAGAKLDPGLLTLRFRDSRGIGAELASLVEAERVCCAFLDWDVVQGDGEWRVEITGRDEDLRTLSFGG